MKKLLLTLLLLVASFNAQAIDPALEPTTTINCSMPIERTDGTPLALDEIAEVRFKSGTATGVYTTVEPSVVCQIVVDNTTKTDGDYFYVVTAVDVDGRESDNSIEKVHTIQRVKPPKSPTWL